MSEIRCLVCGGRGGWWGDGGDAYARAHCSRCHGTGWEQDPPDWLVAIASPEQDHDGFTPDPH
jgi:DnaJ-class molecular chaperone